MTNANALRSMTDERLAHFLYSLCSDPDWIDFLYKSICKDKCPINGKECLVSQQDDWCNHSIEEVFLQWLKTEAI